MSTLASERSWLLNPGPLKLFHQCRRLIQSEFGVKLRLTEDHLEQRLAEYAGKTRSSHLTRTWEALAPQIPTLELPSKDETSGKATENRPKRMYRGQPVADSEATSSKTEVDTTDAEAPTTSRKIYRGQVVG